jgi:hypothetical protein
MLALPKFFWRSLFYWQDKAYNLAG